MRIFVWPSSSRQMNPSPRICKRRSNLYKGIWKDAAVEVRLTLARDFLVGGGAIPQDDKQAALRMQYAVKRGSLLACGLLAGLYEQGQGIPKDRVAAYVWLKLSPTAKSAKSPEGHPDATSANSNRNTKDCKNRERLAG